ncbi:MAG: ECF transporter S component, partial [Treponema sp.]|nr:ECF transporter S component [Treponema sp.]
MESRIRKIVTGGVLSALLIVLGATGLGFIPLPLGAVTVLQIPVIIGAILEGPIVGIFTGLLFGVFSIVQAAIIGVTPVDLAFHLYPWIAIVPRILIGPAAWLVYALVSGRLFRSGTEPGLARESAATAAAAIAGSLVNTVLVLSSFALLLPDLVSWQVVLGLASLNGTVEAGFSAAISLAVILPWKGI